MSTTSRRVPPSQNPLEAAGDTGVSDIVSLVWSGTAHASGTVIIGLLDGKIPGRVTRIDPAVKDRAAEVLEAMGMTVSDAVRILLTRTAREGALPIELLTDEASYDAWFRQKVRAALDELYGDTRASRALSALSDDDLRAALSDAEMLCVDRLEGAP